MSNWLVSLRMPEDCHVSVWSGGSTTELAIFPPDAIYAERNFQWRLSSATVEVERSVFTRLPGVRRWLMPLNGTVELHHGGNQPVRVRPYESDVFDGGEDTVSTGCCRDFNLMTRCGCEGNLGAVLCGPEAKRIVFSSAPGPVTEAFYAADGEIEMQIDGESRLLPRGALLLMRRNGEAGAAPETAVSSALPAHLVRATMRENSERSVQR
ncbi:HutD family protein [Ethanoligenens sp.]|uniref:HutD/Ves family protein n=1 Tax=Ethanoligenens sp. TaxID=2099655 RepID=UPI0039ED8F83